MYFNWIKKMKQFKKSSASKGIEKIKKEKSTIKELEAKLRIKKIFQHLEKQVLVNKEILRISFLENINDDEFMKNEILNHFEDYFEDENLKKKKQQNIKIIKTK